MTQAQSDIGLKQQILLLLLGNLKCHLVIALTIGEDGKSLEAITWCSIIRQAIWCESLLTRQSSIDALRVLDRSLDKIHKKERAKLGALMSQNGKSYSYLSNVALNANASG